MNIVPKTLKIPRVLFFYVYSQTIVAMDQIGGDEVFGSVPVDVEKLEEGYAIAVAIGGTDVAAANVYKALVTYDAETETITVYIGDVNGDGVADGKDATLIMASTIGGNKSAGGTYSIDSLITTVDTTDIVCGDVNGDGVADGKDATLIMASTIGGNKAAGGKFDIGYQLDFQASAN